jgi:hypothetical protein
MLSGIFFVYDLCFAVEAELDDELRFHFEPQVEKCIRSGMKREEARRRLDSAAPFKGSRPDRLVFM